MFCRIWQTPSFMPRMTHVFCITLLAFFLNACGEQEAEPASTDNTPTAAANDHPVAAAEEAQENSANPAEKLNAYVACYNQLNRSAHDSIDRYADWVKDMELGPSGNEKVIYGLYSLNTDKAAECQKAFAQAAKQKPSLEQLDTAAKNYAEALVNLGTAVMDIYPYYDREDYKDDNFAKGKAAHPGLVKNMRTFIDASTNFSQRLDEENTKVQAALLARIEKTEGRKINYWNMSMMLQAKQVVDIMSNEDFPIDAAATRLESFEKVADETSAYARANKEELPILWSQLEKAAEDFRKAAKERLRRVRDKVPYTRGEQMNLSGSSSWMVNGSEGRLIWAYNGLVDGSNRIRH
ncbi:MAG: YiiG family protein [Zoogloeaceae bacterium]|nr:YiiG family protein [Zoogloeaceae bacterium]